MDNGKNPYRLYELALRALENVISGDEFSELNEILRQNPKALDTYYDFITTCSSLYREQGETVSEAYNRHMEESELNSLWLALAEEERTAETIQLPKPAGTSPCQYVTVQKIATPERKISKSSIISVIASLAAILLLVAYVQLVPVPKPIVGHWTDTYEARWAGAVDDIAAGSDLRPGYMELLSGFAHLTLNNGATVIIEGPAQFEVESEGEIFLQEGKLSCTVPPQAVGFTVTTPTASVVDFGTEFGVIVQESGRTEAHVFRGQVDLRTGTNPLVFQNSRRLGSGQGSTVDENETLLPRRFRARSSEFVRNELVPYEIAIRRSSPFAYWRLDLTENTGFQDVLVNKQRPCQVYGNVEVVPGPVLGKAKTGGAARLDGQNSFLYVPKAGDRRSEANKMNQDYSYSFWIRPDVIRAQDLITVTNQGAIQYRHIGLDSDGRFSFFTYYFMTKKKMSEFSGNTVFQPGQWYHVVVTGTKTEGLKSEVHLYVNGRLDASKVVRSTYSPEFFGHFYIGSVPEKGRVEGVGSFDGTIAEVVEYDRALTPEEVQAIYSSVQH